MPPSINMSVTRHIAHTRKPFNFQDMTPLFFRRTDVAVVVHPFLGIRNPSNVKFGMANAECNLTFLILIHRCALHILLTDHVGHIV
jgi:hypothetical protein